MAADLQNQVLENQTSSIPRTLVRTPSSMRQSVHETDSSTRDESATIGLGRAKIAVGLVLAAWLGAIVALGSRDGLVVPPGIPPYPIALGFGVPLILFVAAYWMSDAFRSLLMAADVGFVSAIQAWRFAGFGFIALWTYGVLPGGFAWPAGLGDMAIGLTAPWVALAIARRPSFAAGRSFVIWNLLGILDLVVAVSDGALHQILATGAPAEVTTAPMSQMPLVLVPAFLVPLFMMLHLTGLLQARRLRA
jgi:hypothetical protein